METPLMRLALALWLVPLGVLPLAADLTLVQDGASRYDIVVPEKATRPARFAAEELQRFIAQSTGAKLPIVALAEAGHGHLFVGPSAASAAVGVTPDDVAPEGFHLRVLGEDVHLVGSDTDGDPTRIGSNYPVNTGTLSAVYEFLERFLGVVFAWDDELGTVVPRQATVTIPAADLTAKPAWSYRALAYGPGDATYGIYGRRLRLGHPFSVQHGHNWFGILPVEKYGKEHPEYYALVQGERQAKYYMGSHGGQVCTANPAVIEIFAQAAISYFTANPDRDMFSLSPNDGGGFCECADCRALDGGESLPDDPTMPVLTDRMLHFYNAIAAKVSPVCPGKLLGAYVYSYYQRPPVREKSIHPMLYLIQATNSAMGQGQGWAEEHEGEKKWVALTRSFAKYDIYYYGPPSVHLLAPMTTHLIERLWAEQAIGMSGGYLYIGQTYEQLGAGHYLMARLMWDGKADARALERHYYDALYGPAGGDVKAYYDMLEGRLRRVLLDGETVAEPAVKAMAAKIEGMSSPGQMLAAYWPILEPAEALMQQAEARPLSDLEKQRLARLRDHHDFLSASVRGLIAAGRLETQSAFNEKDVALLKEAVERREAAKVRLAVYAPTFSKYIAEADKGETARVSPDGAFYQLTRNARPLQLSAPTAVSPPTLDGLASEAVWQQAPACYLLLAKSAVPPELGARAKLACDAEHLYVFVEGREPDPGKLLRATTAHDDAKLFDDDAVEVFVQPPGTPGYYQIAVGAGGGLYDGAHPTGDPAQGEATWESGARFAVTIQPHGWAVELAIPFAAFGVAAGPGWKANVYRTRRGNAQPDEYTALNPTFGGYHVPQRFAPLRLHDDSTPVAFADGSFDDILPAEAPKRLQAQAKDGALCELVSEPAWCGSQAVHLTVPQGGLSALTLTAPVKPKTGYRIVLAHYNRKVSLNPQVRDQAPITRVIFRDATGAAVTPTTGYSWSGTKATDKPDQWRLFPHVFTTPEATTQIGFTVFFHHSGEYWVDEVRLEEL
jgi:hypothetical protein